MVYTAMLSAYGRAGRYADAEEMWREMRTAGCVPGLAAYTALMSAYARHGLVAVSLCQSMQGQTVIPPSRAMHSYN